MKTLKLIIAAIIGLMLMVVVAANMEPVDVELWPREFGIGTLGVYGVPLALVIFVSLALGFLLGELAEWGRERRHRKRLSAGRRKITELQTENDRLLRRMGAEDDEIEVIGR